MLEKMIFYAKLYVDSDKNCIRVFEKFCNIYRQREVTSEIFNFYFTNWLPKIYGQTEIWRVENMLPAVMDFCHDYDCEGDTFTEDILYDLPCCIELDLKRILKLKSEILKFTDSPYISFLPYVFNFSSKENFSKKVVDTIKGSFKMAEVFTNNSIVINKLSGYNSYVRTAAVPMAKGDQHILRQVLIPEPLPASEYLERRQLSVIRRSVLML